MEALDALLTRVSSPRLTEPAPTAEQRERLFQAALRAPDHGQLRPWRFLTVEGAARNALGQLYADALLVRDAGASEEALNKARAMPLRAPLLVVVIARVQVHPKVPEVEQLMAAACAAHGMILAAYAQDIGAVWRTGEMAYDPTVEQGLGLQAGEKIVGYLYLGTPERAPRTAPLQNSADFVSSWSGR